MQSINRQDVASGDSIKAAHPELDVELNVLNRPAWRSVSNATASLPVDQQSRGGHHKPSLRVMPKRPRHDACLIGDLGQFEIRALRISRTRIERAARDAWPVVLHET